MTEPITIVVAKIHAKPGQEAAVRAALAHVAEESRKEPGALLFDPHQSLDTPTEFIVYEHWKYREAVKEHMALPHVREFMGRSAELFSAPIDVTFWQRF